MIKKINLIILCMISAVGSLSCFEVYTVKERSYKTLYQSAKQDDLKSFKFLISDGYNLSKRDENGQNVLHFAFKNDSYRVAEFILNEIFRLRNHKLIDSLLFMRDKEEDAPFHLLFNKKRNTNSILRLFLEKMLSLDNRDFGFNAYKLFLFRNGLNKKTEEEQKTFIDLCAENNPSHFVVDSVFRLRAIIDGKENLNVVDNSLINFIAKVPLVVLKELKQQLQVLLNQWKESNKTTLLKKLAMQRHDLAVQFPLLKNALKD